ncbi:unnamed protein product, partial [Rotaria magnacalcarata]
CIPDGELVVIIEDVGSVTSSPTSKRVKPNDDDDDILYDIEHIHDSLNIIVKECFVIFLYYIH